MAVHHVVIARHAEGSRSAAFSRIKGPLGTSIALLAVCAVVATYQASGDGWGRVALAAKTNSAKPVATATKAVNPEVKQDPEAKEIKQLKQELRAAKKQVAASKLAVTHSSLSGKEPSIFEGKSWCSGCAPTYPLANVVSSNAQRVASNSDNMMAIYRKTNAGLAHVNKELGALVGMQRQVDLAPAEDTSPYSSPYTSAGPYATPYANPNYGYARPVGYRAQYQYSAQRPAAPFRPGYGFPYDARAPAPALAGAGAPGYVYSNGYVSTGYAGDEYRFLPSSAALPSYGAYGAYLDY